MSRPYSWFTIREKKSSRWQLTKSAVMDLVSTSWSSFNYLIFAIADSILLALRAIIQMLNPNAASSSQKPSPIPSEPPVTTAQVFLPYL